MLHLCKICISPGECIEIMRALGYEMDEYKDRLSVLLFPKIVYN